MLPRKDWPDNYDGYIGNILADENDEPHLILVSPGIKIQLMINKIGYRVQYLYLISDAPIEEGDYFYNRSTKEILYASKEMLSWNSDTSQEHKGWKKVIATDDKNLNLPILPKRLITTYVVKQGKINNIKIKTDEMGSLIPSGKYVGSTKWIADLDLTIEGEVIVLSIDDGTYTREEIRTSMHKVLNMGMEIRQNQLRGREDRSGNEIFEEWFNKTYPI